MNELLSQVSYPVFLYMSFVFCLIASVFSFAVGIALVSRSGKALQFFDLMNRWVSVRKMMKPLSTPHFVEPLLLKRPRILGASIIVGALATILLLVRADLASALSMFDGSLSAPQIMGASENLKAFLLVGNVICLLLGAVILFFPDFLATLERYTDRWYSIRQSTHPLDRMHMEVDCWVLKHPTSVGLALCILSFSTGLLMLGQLQKL